MNQQSVQLAQHDPNPSLINCESHASSGWPLSALFLLFSCATLALLLLRSRHVKAACTNICSWPCWQWCVKQTQHIGSDQCRGTHCASTGVQQCPSKQQHASQVCQEQHAGVPVQVGGTVWCMLPGPACAQCSRIVWQNDTLFGAYACRIKRLNHFQPPAMLSKQADHARLLHVCRACLSTTFYLVCMRRRSTAVPLAMVAWALDRFLVMCMARILLSVPMAACESPADRRTHGHVCVWQCVLLPAQAPRNSGYTYYTHTILPEGIWGCAHCRSGCSTQPLKTC